MSIVGFIVAFLIMAAITPLLIGVGVAWFGLAVSSTYNTIMSFISLLNPANWTNFDFISFAFWTIVSISIDAAGGLVAFFWFLFALWLWQSFVNIIAKDPNVAMKIVLADNGKEVTDATTRGIYGVIYRKFIERHLINLFMPRLEGSTAQAVDRMYPKGTAILMTPAATWPVAVGSYGGSGQLLDLYAGEIGAYFVLVLMSNGASQAIAILDKTKAEAVRAKLAESKASLTPIDSIGT